MTCRIVGRRAPVVASSQFGDRQPSPPRGRRDYRDRVAKHKLALPPPECWIVAKAIAGRMLGADIEEVRFEDGLFSAPRSNRTLTVGEIAKESLNPENLPDGMDLGLIASAMFSCKDQNFPNGCHICELEVDEETGEVEITRYVAVDDCGRQINPLLVEGQVHGGIVQGVGQALYEGVVYGEDGQLLTATLMDYAMPIAPEFPLFELDSTVTLTTLNPLGVKGVGEAGTIGSTPAVASAVADALGVAHVDMPCSAEKLWKIIHQQQ